MRVTFISPTVNMGGGTRVIAIYARALMEMGHDVCVVSTPGRATPAMQKVKAWLAGTGSPAGVAPSYFDGSGIDHRVLERWRPVSDNDVPDGDVIIATWWLTAEWVAALNARKGAKVYFIQGHEVHEHLPIDRVRATYQLPFHKIVVAPWLKRLMAEQYGDTVVDVVPNSVDRRQFFAPERGKQAAPTVGLLYAVGQVKGLDAALAAIRSVRERVPSLRTISFGSRPPRPEFALPEGSQFFHLPPQDRIRDIYASCDVWLTASRSEGFNLPALEAMACRTPVVSTRTGWPPEVIKTKWNGDLVDIDDVPGLARGVQWVLSRSDDEWRTLSANAFATAAAGSWQESAKLFEKALEHACERAGVKNCHPKIGRSHR